MKKVAIVGVEGSGKTVMLAGLGDLYTYPDEDGYFLSPKNFSTAAYVSEKIDRMRKGEWPSATAGDEIQGLDWTLKRNMPEEGGRPKPVCEVSFLDFAGEVYRTAFGIGTGDASFAEQANELKRYVSEADDLIVLINLRDVIADGVRDKRVQEAMWITKAILDTALSEEPGHKTPRTAIVLSQADSYANTIKDCGGAKGVLKKYLPHVANDYGWLNVFAASAVDKTVMDDDGNIVPAPDFQPTPLNVIMDWIQGGIVQDKPTNRPVPQSRSPVPQRSGQQGKQIKGNISSKPKPVVQGKVNVFVFALTLITALGSAAISFVGGHERVAIFLGLLFLGLGGAREDKETKQDVVSWLACIPLLLLAGVLGATGHWIWASISGLMTIGLITRDSGKTK